MKKIIIKLINLYQKTISPDHGALKYRYPYGFCRHYPTCSEYSKKAIDYHGVFKGGIIAVIRILKCNPWTSPKIDFRYIKSR